MLWLVTTAIASCILLGCGGQPAPTAHATVPLNSATSAPANGRDECPRLQSSVPVGPETLIALCFGQTAPLPAGGSGSPVAVALSGGASMGLAFAAGSHAIGIFPAAIVGLLCGPFRPCFNRSWRYCLIAALLGALVATVFAFVAVGDEQRDNPYLMFSLAGFVGALLVSRIFGLRASNSSYVPTPLRGAA